MCTPLTIIIVIIVYVILFIDFRRILRNSEGLSKVLKVPVEGDASTVYYSTALVIKTEEFITAVDAKVPEMNKFSSNAKNIVYI